MAMTAPVESPEFSEMLDLAIDSIEPDPDQPRRIFSEEDIASLAASIRSTGLIQPIVVLPNPGAAKPYRILVGERRWRASLQAGHRTVRAIVRRDPLSPADRLMVQLAENDDRAPLSIFERAQAVRRALDLSTLTKSRFAAQYGKSPAWLSGLLSVAEAEGFTLAAYKADLLRHAETGRVFAKLPPEIQRRLLSRAEETRTPITRSVVQSTLERLESRSRSAVSLDDDDVGEDGPDGFEDVPPESAGDVRSGQDEPPIEEQGLAPVAFPAFGRSSSAAQREPHVALDLTRRRAEVLFDLFGAAPDDDSLDACAAQIARLIDSQTK
jgi:ParB/RepB/Spo0J family partition protein